MNKSVILAVFASFLLLSVFVIADGNETNGTNSTGLNDSEDDDLNDSEDDDVLGCKTLYWIDAQNRNCSSKEFCGTYMYQGLRVFEDEEDCLEAINASEAMKQERERIREAIKDRREDLKEQIKDKLEERKELREDIRERLKNGENLTLAEKKLIIQRIDEEILLLRAERAMIRTRLNLSGENESDLKVYMGNGRYALVKIMPETASERALERLRLKNCNETRNCTIELKEVGKGNETRAVYEARAEKKFRVFGIFKNKEYVSTQVDSETGEVVRTHKPWWSWMASEEDETSED
jgi:hypothetical protein